MECENCNKEIVGKAIKRDNSGLHYICPFCEKELAN